MTVEDLKQLFIDYYGEENVDSGEYVQEGDFYCNNATWQIVVHWNKVTVTNEYDSSIIIYDLFAKIPLKMEEGKLVFETSFLLCRNTATKLQYAKGYIHSHIQKAHTYLGWTYSYPCLGRGPIKSTIHTLWKNSNDADIWRLFIWELDKYVHTESMKGVPYVYMYQVTTPSLENEYSLYAVTKPENTEEKKIINRFISYLIDNKLLKFTFYNKGIIFAYTDVELMLKLSNDFIDFVNSNKDTLEYKPNVIQSRFMDYYVYNHRRFYKYLNEAVNLYYPKNYTICTFKNKPQYFNIIESAEEQTSKNILLLLPVVFSYICIKILTALNKYYGTDRIS